MGHPNEDLLRKGYEAFAQGDLATLSDLLADDIVWHVPGSSPLAGEYRGKQEVFGFFGKIAELSGGNFRLEIHDVLANDKHGVALVKASGNRQGRTLNDNAVHVWDIEGGTPTGFWSYPGDQQAVDAFWS
jgi:ketosteroid isomerase-like protein